MMLELDSAGVFGCDRDENKLTVMKSNIVSGPIASNTGFAIQKRTVPNGLGRFNVCMYEIFLKEYICTCCKHVCTHSGAATAGTVDEAT